MSYGFTITGVGGIDYGRAGIVKREAEMVSERYAEARHQGATKLFGAMFDEMLGMPSVSQALPKTPMVGSEVGDQASFASTSVGQWNFGRGGNARG